MNIFHRHTWKPIETKYPVRVTSRYGFEDGTLVYWTCDCGKEKVTEHLFRNVIWKGHVVHVIGDEK